ncbi:MAG: DNA-binding protein [Rhizobiales bacterium]|nr:DNA-binding protein [Hyphomicrobiales bacterium]
MKITALRFHNVKRFAREGVAIEDVRDGVNVLCAANEYGKSTSFEALHALFFLPHTGTAQEVRRLQPYSGGNPLIQADITVPDGRFRLTKQFIGGKRATVENLDTARLIAQADEAERFIAGLIRGGTAGPAGLLWVRQGNTGIGDRAKKDEEGERQIRESLLTSVQGEVEAVTGGRRMLEIIGACQDELSRLVTPTGRPKTGGPFLAALEERDQLAGEEKRLAAEVATLRDALDKRAIAQKRLKELADPNEKALLRGAVTKAEAALERARSHADQLAAAEAQGELARSRAEAAQQDLDAFRAAMAQNDALRGQLQSARQKRDDALVRRAQAAGAIDAAMAETQAAEAREAEARALLARLDAALKARQAMDQLQELRDRLGKAEAVRAALEDGEAALALVAIPPDAIEALQRLEIDIAHRRAAEDAQLPSVVVTYDPGASTALIMDGQPLASGAERPVRDRARIDIAGVGTLVVRSNRPAESDGKLQAAEQRRQGLLASMGVASLSEAQRRQSEAQELVREMDRRKIELRHLAPEGLARLREEIARREAVAPELLEMKGDPEEVREALALADRQVATARNRAREVQPMHRHASDAVTAAETAFATMERDMARLEAMLGPEAERTAREQSLALARDTLHAASAQHETRCRALRSAAPDLSSAEAALRRAVSAEDVAKQEENRLELQLADLGGQIRTRSDDAVEEKWQETAEALRTAEARVAAFEAEVAVLDRLGAALQASRTAARDLYLQPVIAELRPLLELMFDDVSIVFDEKTLLPQTIRRNGQDEDIDRLSGGMREQLSILTRLAFARLLAQDGRPAPVILDDALVYSDDDRIERMFDALHRQSRGQQIIVFSCRQRAFAKLGGNVLQMTRWQPDAA